MRIEVKGERLSFRCPGCGDEHNVSIASGRWTWNGAPDRPTINPSVLATSGHFCQGGEQYCWCTYNEERSAKGEELSKFKCYRCHSFVRNGMIEFLNDCSHEHAGQTMELPELGSMEQHHD